MDASTQTTWLSRDGVTPKAAQSRGTFEPYGKDHKYQERGDGEIGEDSKESDDSVLDGGDYVNEKVSASFAGSPSMPAFIDDAIPVTGPLSGREIAISSSPSSLGVSSSGVAGYPSDPQRRGESTRSGRVTDSEPVEGTKVKLENTTPHVGGIQMLGHLLRRRPDRQSQAETHFMTVPGPQDAADYTSAAIQPDAYVLKVVRALMLYGAPTHRLEEYVRRTAEVLGLHIQSFYMPGCMIISFSDTSWRSKEVHIVRCVESLNLSKLDDVHAVYKDIIHRRIAIEEAMARIDKIMARGDRFPLWFQVLLFGLASTCIGPVSYNARPIDLPIIFLLGSLLGYMQLILAQKSELYAHVFELSIAILTSFIARAFGSIPLTKGTQFCFAAICQAPLVMILPGFLITSSALELQSKNMVSGSVRLVYAIIFTLFLSFGITIGITIYGAIDSGATSDTQCATTWPFWWQILFVPFFTLFYSLINQVKWSKTPATILLSLSGWTVNHFSAQAFSANPQIGPALGALTVGILANTYSRLGRGLAVSIMHPAIFINVPGSLAAGGSLISGLQSANDLTRGNRSGTVTTGQPQGNNAAALNAGYAMVEIGIAITVGLSTSALLVYPFRKKTGKSGLFSF